jgi:hypothetical protein
MRTFAHLDLACDLPEDILRKCTIRQDYIFVRGLEHIPRNLKDEDVVSVDAFKVDVIGDHDVCAERVDARRQWSGLASKGTTEDSSSEIDPRGVFVRAPRGIDVRGLHVADRCSHPLRSRHGVVRRVGLASDLQRCRILSTRVPGLTEAGQE